MKNAFALITVCIVFIFYSCVNETKNKTSHLDKEEKENTKPSDDVEIDTSLIVDTTIIENTNEEKTIHKDEIGEKEHKEDPRKPAPIIEKPNTEPVHHEGPKTIANEIKPPSTPVKIVEDKKEEVTTTPILPHKPTEEVSAPGPVEEPPAPQVQPLSHDTWNQLLQKYVSATGVVNYSGFKSNKKELETYLKILENNPPTSKWSSKKEMAYWINAYNAWTIKTIIDHYPISSITKIDGGKTWNVKRVKSGNKTYSLDEVENKILRPKFNDARIHFAVNCAAKSCPPLLNKAWTASNLNANLDKMAKAFINNSKFNTIEKKKIQISKIFEWYAADFGDIITYLNKYLSITIDKKAKIEYVEYDWSLNGN